MHNKKHRKQRMAGKRPKEPGIFEQAGNAVMGGLRAVDDSTQAFMRNQVLGLPTDGSALGGKGQRAPMEGARHALGHIMFRARPDYAGDKTAYRGTGTNNDFGGMVASRALQGGMVTAAGAGLAALTTQFGGQADQPEPNQLPLY